MGDLGVIMNKKARKELAEKSREDLEKQRLMIEINEMQTRTMRRVVNTIAIALISIPTIWFYYKEFAEPFMQIDKIELSNNVRELMEQYEYELNDVKQQKNDLENQKNLLAEEKENLEHEYLAVNKQKQKQKAEFQKQLKEIRNEYKRLSSLYKSKTKESEAFKKKVASLNGLIKEKNGVIKDIDKNIKQVKSRDKVKKFRTSPAYLTDVKTIISGNNFYDSKNNPQGRGFPNQFLIQKKKECNVIVDKTTGLIWQQEGSGTYLDYASARQRIRELNRKRYAGYKDWRLPTVEEAMSLMEPKKTSNGLFINPLFGRNQIWIWTADQLKSKSWAWVVDFKYGECLRYNPGNGSYVRAVRSGT